MPYAAPLYEAGDTVYLRESANSGFIEVHTIFGVERGRNGWVYTVTVRPSLPVHAPHYGERRSLVNGALIKFEECEFVNLCDALILAQAYHQNQLSIIESRLRVFCPTTAGTSETVSTSGTSGS